MKIVPLSPALEPKFWEYVNQDIPHYFFFALDWKHSRSDTRIFLALKGNRIDGMMLIFKERTVQLRGSPESAEALLEKLVLRKAELQVSEEHEKSVLEKYQPTCSHELILMMLRKGEESLHKLLETDEGAKRLGEVALVPHSSPISQSGLLFYNILIDENASNHIALGRAYKFSLENGEAMSDDEFAAIGGNHSLIHIDCMIGSGEMAVDGLMEDGTAEPIMRGGEWAFEV